METSRLQKVLNHFSVLLFAFIFVNALSAFAVPGKTTYQAKIVKPDGYPLEASSVNFKFTILDPAGSCILYSETYSSLNMSGTGGLISFALGSGVKTYPASATTFEQVFSNITPSLSCDTGGPASYSPAATDIRKIVMQFHDGSGWQTLPAMSINAVPYAMYANEATKLNGLQASDFVQVSTVPTCAASEALRYTGTGFTCVAVGSSVTSSTVVTALGYTPADGASVTTLTSNVLSVSSTVASVSSTVFSVSSTVTSLQNSVAASFAAITSSQWTTSGTNIFYNTGNIGIGTTSPLTQFDVYSATSANAFIGVPSSTFPAGSAHRLYIGDSAGTGYGELHLVTKNSGANSYLGAISFTNYNEGTSLKSLSRIEGYSDAAANQGRLSFWTTSTGGNNITEKMRITPTGNVGIATTTPVTKLDVSGGVRISMESATCTVSYAGTLRYNASNIEYCNGTSWQAFGVSGAGITNFNGSTSGTQTLATGTGGTAPNIVTANGVHTLSIPLASTGSVTAGLISNTDYTTFSNKITSSAASIAQVLGYVPADNAASGTYAQKANNLSDLTNVATARTNLGLGALAVGNSIDLGSASATGIIADARLANQSGVTSGTQYTKVTVDEKGRVTSGAQLSSSDVTTALGYTPANSATIISSQWSTSGTTINYTAGSVGIGTTTPVTKLDVSGGVRIGGESTTCAPALAGTLRYNASNVEYCNGTSWQAFGVSSSGLTSLNGSTSQTQTFANATGGTAPNFNTSNGVHTLSIPLASTGSVTAGLISNTDYTTFTNKITSSAASIAQVLGYVPANDAASGTYAQKANNLSDLTNIATARTNLGLGTFATASSIDLGSASATGTLAIARLPSFTGDATIAAASNTIILSNSGVTAGTYTKVTVDSKGRVTSGAQITSGDVTTALGYTPANSATIVSSQWSTSGTTINYMNGNVGIGTTTPLAKLDVTGAIRFGSGGAIANSDTNNNLFIGETTGTENAGFQNVAVGNQTLKLNTIGDWNTAVGYSALQNTTADENTGVGAFALSYNSTGYYNTALGSNAVYMNTTGAKNVGLGVLALFSNKQKDESTAIGFSSMRYADANLTNNITYNTAVGAYSLQGSTTATNNTGTMNTALGHSALKSMTSGSGNVGMGYSAGSSITTGSNNIVIGSNNGSSIATSSNNILIADGAGNERLRINSTGNVGIGTTTPSAELHLAAGTSSNAPLKLTSGTLLTSPQSGTMEYDGTNFYLTDSTNTRRAIAANANPGTYDNVSNINSSGNITLTPTGSVVVSSTTASTNSSTGALVVKGGLGVAGNLNVAGTISGSAKVIATGFRANQGAPDAADNSTNGYAFGTDGDTGMFSPGSGVANGVLAFYGNNAEQMRITASGTVGIGTTSPLFKMHIKGTVMGTETTPDWQLSVSKDYVISNGLGAGPGILLSHDTYLSGQKSAGIASPAEDAGYSRRVGLGFWTSDFDTVRSEKMRITGTGNVGIGTTTPGAPLSFADSKVTKIQFNGNNANGYQVGLANSVNGGDALYKFDAGLTSAGEFGFYSAGTSKMFISSSGNVGIGTAAPTQMLDVVKTTGDGFTRMKTDGADSDSGFIAQNDAQTWKVYNKAGYSDALVFEDVNASVQAMTIKKTTGNVGIGTTAPTARFDVERSDAHEIAEFTQGAPASYNTDVWWRSSEGNDWLLSKRTAGAETGDFWIWEQGQAARFVIKQGGNVGIGTTSPTEKLHVQGNSKVGDTASTGTVYMQLLGMHDTAGGSGFRLQFDRTNDIFGIAREWSGFQSPSFVIKRSDGNVGIGTTNPSAKLSVSGTALFGANGNGHVGGVEKIHIAGANSNPTMIATTNSGIRTMFMSAGALNTIGTDGGDISFRTSAAWTASDPSVDGSDRMRITAAGNIGIGTTSPSYKLQVQQTASGTPAMMIGGGFAGGPRLQTYGLDADSNAWMGLGTDMGGNIYEHSIYFSTGPSNNGRLTIGDYNGAAYNTRMTVLQNGNVGIATNNPQAKLHVAGDVRIVDGNQAAGRVLASDANGTGAWKQTIIHGTIAAVGNTSDGSARVGSGVSITLPPGKWQITGMGITTPTSCRADFGVRNSGTNTVIKYTLMPAATGDYTTATVTAYVDIASTTNYDLYIISRAACNSQIHVDNSLWELTATGVAY